MEKFENNYKIIDDKIIGRGGFGNVYEGKYKKNGEKRAIKFINKEKIKSELESGFNTNIDEEFNKFQKQLNKEIEGMKICYNTNSIKCYEYYDTKKDFIIIMELCDTNLFSLLKETEKGFNSGEIRDFLIQLNNTFKIMKKNNIIHRDLKLENILVKYEGHKKVLKLADYGTCRKMTKTKLTHNIGTPKTMSPEVLRGENYNTKCDLWSLGVIIYQLAFKKDPYNGNTEAALLNNIDNYGQALLEKHKDSKLDNLIRHLLVKDLDKRYNWDQYLNDKFFK